MYECCNVYGVKNATNQRKKITPLSVSMSQTSLLYNTEATAGPGSNSNEQLYWTYNLRITWSLSQTPWQQVVDTSPWQHVWDGELRKKYVNPLSPLPPQFLRHNTRYPRKAMINHRKFALDGSVYYITHFKTLRIVDFQTEWLPRCFQLVVHCTAVADNFCGGLLPKATIKWRQHHIWGKAVVAFCSKPVRGRSNWFQRAGRLGSRSNCQAAPPHSQQGSPRYFCERNKCSAVQQIPISYHMLGM